MGNKCFIMCNGVESCNNNIEEKVVAHSPLFPGVELKLAVSGIRGALFIL